MIEKISPDPFAPKELNKVIVIASSVGGVDALMALVPGIPARLRAAVLIVQHMADHQPSLLAEILDRKAQMQVMPAREGAEITNGIIYVAEPGKHLKLQASKILLDGGGKVRYVRPAADVLFSSAAQSFGEFCIGVVLTGSGSDGTEGCRQIQKHGGTTIAQDEETSTFFQMPKAAIAARCIDHVLPLEDIAGKLVDLVATPPYLNQVDE